VYVTQSHERSTVTVAIFIPAASVSDMAQYVTVEHDDALATVTIDRPEKLHALNSDLIAELSDALDAVAEREAVAVILRSTGDRAFVAGADLSEFAEMTDAEAFRAFQEREQALNRQIATLPGIVVAAVDGVAFGGGFELALAADVIVAGESAEFAFPEVTRGLIPGATYGAQWLPRLVGLPKAIELIAGSEPISAAEAAQLNLVNRVVADEGVDEAAREFAETLTSNAPLAVRAAKRVCTQSAYGDLSTVLEYGTEVTTRLFETADAAEGLRAFVDGEEPRFEGR
jgi:enoyl-CoA hydratase